MNCLKFQAPRGIKQNVKSNLDNIAEGYVEPDGISPESGTCSLRRKLGQQQERLTKTT